MPTAREAIALYQQSLQISESIGNIQGKAATLHCLANKWQTVKVLS
ncbi:MULTISPECIES: hypothetical protein [unclassified Dolichospermum]|jgi:hypothetical protein|nr:MULTISPECIES: hypothetical protein [unclassified Dolichospermum]MBO1054436.1 hypothetical protein [Dolichospermum sp. DET73]